MEILLSKSKIAKYLYDFHQFQLNGFYEKDESEISWSDLSDFEQMDSDQISQAYFVEISDYLITVYLQNLEIRPIDEIIETIAMFFGRLRAITLPVINLDIIVINEEYSNTLEEEVWNGHNWAYLEEKSLDQDLIDKTFLREISKDFLTKVLSIKIPVKQRRPSL